MDQSSNFELPDRVLLPEDLVSGYSAFSSETLPQEKALYEVLAELGQKPKTLVIACCDSRAAPETIFNAAPGELFVVRNVANLVPPYKSDDGLHGTSAALEFAVLGLKVENIIVLGHGRCSGVQSFLVQKEGIIESQPLSPGNFIGHWITLLEPASREMICEDTSDFPTRKRALEEAGIRMSLRNLMTFPDMKSLVADGKLNLFGAWFDISSGDLFAMERETGEFKEVQP